MVLESRTPERERLQDLFGRLAEICRSNLFIAAFVAVGSTTAVLLMVVRHPHLGLGLILMSLLVIAGRKMANLVDSLGPDEVAVVTGRWSPEPKIVTEGKVIRQPGDRVTKMSLAWQPVSFEVECRTFDEIPVAFGATGSFRLRYDLRALAAVARAFGGNHGTMKDHVKACYMGQLRDVVGASTAADIDRNAGHATAEAMRRSVHILSRDGFELSPLVAERVDFSDEWRNEQGQRQVLEARSHRVTRELEIERAVHRERAMFAAMEQEIKAEATAKSNSIIELERIRIAEAHLALNRKKRSDDREHEQAMAVIEAFRLAEMLRTKAGYHEVLIQQQIVERLPEILEAKGKLVPNLRTYIGGSQGKGLVELITGLAAIGPDIMPELRDVINSLSKSGSPDAITGPDPGPATGPRPGDGSQIVPPDDAETP